MEFQQIIECSVGMAGFDYWPVWCIFGSNAHLVLWVWISCVFLKQYFLVELCEKAGSFRIADDAAGIYRNKPSRIVPLACLTLL